MKAGGKSAVGDIALIRKIMSDFQIYESVEYGLHSDGAADREDAEMREPEEILHVFSVPIEEYEACLYWMDTRKLENESYFSRYYDHLSYERRNKVDSYLFIKDRRLSLGAGILIDRGLSSYGMCERGTTLAYGENGKPYFPGYPHIHFNLSHSGNWAMAVFANVETGCDIEKMQEADLELAEKFFAPKEYAYIAGQQGKKKQDEAFFRIWTLKESYIKAVGAGLSLALDSFEVNILQKGEIRMKRKDGGEGSFLEEFDFRQYRFGEYCAAVCFQKGFRKQRPVALAPDGK